MTKTTHMKSTGTGFWGWVADGFDAIEQTELDRLAECDATIARLNAAGASGWLSRAEEEEIALAHLEARFIRAKRAGASSEELQAIRDLANDLT